MLLASTLMILSGCSFDSGVSVSAGITQMNVLNDSLNASSSSCAAYEIFVGSYRDSNGDGIGDINGITESLDHISGMGFDMIWLTPVFTSPTYHKYDVEDYYTIDPSFGDLSDLEELINECHERGISVITDFVMNHTSVEHEWFIEASDAVRGCLTEEDLEEAASQCEYVDYYNFSMSGGSGYVKLPDSEVYYEAEFWEGMPDLNLSSEAVRNELLDAASYWLSEGVDGFRLDAVTYFYSGSDQGNIDYLTGFVDRVRSVAPSSYIVCEAWTDPITYIPYYQSGVDGMFNFSFSGKDGVIGRVAGGLSPASSYGSSVADYQERLEELAGVPLSSDASFYTNHDMGRSAGYFAGDEASYRVRLAGALNLLMSGRTFVYYGEEIGMKGSGSDENFRAPMYWSDDPSFNGLCQPPPGMAQFEMKYPSLEDQIDDPLSVYNYYRQAVLLRSYFPVISRGEVTFYPELSDDNICVIEKTDGEGDTPVLIAINTSSNEQTVDLSALPYDQLAAVLAVSYDEATLSGGTLTLPPFFIAVLTGS